jgi:two-component system response regulator VanR
VARILILEDEPDLADLYRLTLEGEGHEVVGIFEDPREPVRRASEHPGAPRPDLIIVDERLAGLSGTEHIPLLRAAFPGARVLVATADPAAGKRALLDGADGVKQKPFHIQELVGVVQDLLDRAKGS